MDTNDPTFSNPTEYISPIYDHAQTQVLQVEKDRVFKADGHSFRRVVPSPQPKRIVERDVIQTLITHDHLVIYNGDGDASVVEKADGYHEIEAVIDKNLSAALLASQICADVLLILAGMDAVYLSWGKPTRYPLAQVMSELPNKMQFGTRSIGPKATACAGSVGQCRSIARIDSLADGPEVLAGDEGTLIRLDTPITTPDLFL